MRTPALLIPMLLTLALAACDSAPPTATPDIEATVSAAIAATATAEDPPLVHIRLSSPSAFLSGLKADWPKRSSFALGERVTGTFSEGSYDFWLDTGYSLNPVPEFWMTIEGTTTLTTRIAEVLRVLGYTPEEAGLLADSHVSVLLAGGTGFDVCSTPSYLIIHTLRYPDDVWRTRFDSIQSRFWRYGVEACTNPGREALTPTPTPTAIA